MPLQPIALPPALPSELLTFILSHSFSQATLLICKSREDFFSSLASMTLPVPSEPASSPPQLRDPSSHDETGAPLLPKPQYHPLLIPTLHQVATSRQIRVIFIPTVSHLRAWLNVFPPASLPPCQKDDDTQRREKKGRKQRLLVVYGLIELHRDGSEWSAQGLGNTVSGLVEAGWRGGMRVLALEEKLMRGVEEVDMAMEGQGEEELNPDGSPAVRDPAMEVWNERVPMLNGSVRRAGLDSKDGAWSGRTIEVGRILSRWFKFSKIDWGAHA